MQTVVFDGTELSRTRLARRSQLLEVAAGLFVRDGYRATTMEGLATTAGVSKATLYKYFPDKERLFLALVQEHRLGADEHLLAELRSSIQQVLAQMHKRPDAHRLQRTFQRLLRASAQRHDDVFFRLMVEIAFASPALIDAIRREMLDEQTADSLAATQAQAGDVDVAAILHVVFLAIHGQMMIGDVPLAHGAVDVDRLAAALATMVTAALGRE
jgi:AcrR family transcriptional regulator